MHVNGVIQTWTIKPYQNGWSLENVKGTLPTFFFKVNVIMTLRGGGGGGGGSVAHRTWNYWS